MIETGPPLQSFVPRATYKMLALIGIIICLSLPSVAIDANDSNKWRLQVSGGAESDGVIVITVTTADSQSIVTEIGINKGTGENHVARRIVRGLESQLPGDRFHVERDDGEDVLIKRKLGEGAFDVNVNSNTVKGVRINRDRE